MWKDKNCKGTLATLALVAGLTAGACDGGGAVSDIRFADVRQAVNNPDPAAVQQYVAGIKGKKIRWSGVVTEAVRQFGDDYAEGGTVLVDMDQGTPGLEAPDVTFDIKPSQLRSLKSGQPITFVGVIRGIESGPEGRLVKLELNTIE